MPKTSSAPKKFFRRSGETIKNSYRRHTKWWIIGIVVLIGLIVGLAVGLTVGKGDSAKILSQAEVETALASGDFTIQSNEQLTLTSTLNIPEGRTLTVSGTLFIGGNGITGETLIVDNGNVRSQESQEIRTLDAVVIAYIKINVAQVINDSVWDASNSVITLQPNQTLTVTDSQMICSTITFEGEFTEEYVINLGKAPLVPQDDGSEAPGYNLTCLNGLGEFSVDLKLKATSVEIESLRTPLVDLKGTTTVKASLTLEKIICYTETLVNDGGEEDTVTKVTLTDSALRVTETHTMDPNSELDIDKDSGYKISGRRCYFCRKGLLLQGV